MTRMKSDSFGSVNICKVVPKFITEKTIAISIPFKDALHLHLALGDCLSKLNRYHMATKRGRNAAVKLNLYTEKMRLMVLED